MSIAARSLSIGDHVRGIKGKGLDAVYKVKEKQSDANILCWRVNPTTGAEMENDFVFIRGEDQVEKASI